MPNKFPIGSAQTISSQSGLSVTLDSCDFDPSLDLIGYKRSHKQDYMKKVKHLLIGSPSITGPRHPQFFEFEWALNISVDKYHILYAIWQEQTELINLYAGDIDVKLFDQRLALLTKSPRQRAMLLGYPALPIFPAGYVYIWPIFSILITGLEQTLLMPDKQIVSVKMQATELRILSTDFDE